MLPDMNYLVNLNGQPCYWQKEQLDCVSLRAALKTPQRQIVNPSLVCLYQQCLATVASKSSLSACHMETESNLTRPSWRSAGPAH